MRALFLLVLGRSVAGQTAYDECEEANGHAVCAAGLPAGSQKCVDAHPTDDSKDDWVCLCIAPYDTKQAKMKAANCAKDECACMDTLVLEEGRNYFGHTYRLEKIGIDACRSKCLTMDRCVAMTHTKGGKPILARTEGKDAEFNNCVDYDVTTPCCWLKDKVDPRIDLHFAGSSGLKSAPPCLADICKNADQICVDDNHDVENDWVCKCDETKGFHGQEKTDVAQCSKNECETLVIDMCNFAHEMAECVDPDFDNLDDWVCRCKSPYVGEQETGRLQAEDHQGTFHLVACELDECRLDNDGHDVLGCSREGQECKEGSMSTDGDAMCKCKAPAHGQNKGGPVPGGCPFDECETHTDTCAVAAQQCNDDDKTKLDDWVCACVPPAEGTPVKGGLATCVDKGQDCRDHGHICHEVGQVCDPGVPEDDGNFECKCKGPDVGVQKPDCEGKMYEINKPSKPFDYLDCTSFNFNPSCNCDTKIKGAFVEIEDPTYEMDADKLVCNACDGLNIKQEFTQALAKSAGSGILVLKGEYTIAQYTEALKSVEFVTSSRKGHDRRLTYNFGHGEYAGGHFYEYISREDCIAATGHEMCDWEAGQMFCAQRDMDLLGLAGYLVTITSKEERHLLDTKVIAPGHMWAGGTDIGTENYFRWVTGPEGCVKPGDEARLATDGPARTSCDIYPLKKNDNSHCSGPDCSWKDPSAMITYKARYGWQSGNGECKQASGYCNWMQNQPDNSKRPAAKGGGTENFMYLNHVTGGGWNDGGGMGASMGVMCEWGGLGELCLEEAFGTSCLTLGEEHSGVSGKNGHAWCELDECEIECITCAKRENEAHTCAAADQDCEDSNRDPASTHDWICYCREPKEGEAEAAVATCEINECVHICDTCAAKDDTGNACENNDQACVDEDLVGLNNWECQCIPPTSGFATTNEAAICILDECSIEENEKVCTDALTTQICVDDDKNLTSTNDWECRCEAPSSTVTVAAAASVCVVDECAPELDHWKMCSSAKQACVDVDNTTLNDWACQCYPPASGREAQNVVVECALDECAEECSTCATQDGTAHVCSSASQECTDPTPTTKVVGDWFCICRNGAGTAKAAAAVCAYDECVGVSTAALSCKHVPRYTVMGCLCKMEAGCCDDSSGTGFGVCEIDTDSAYNKEKPQCMNQGMNQGAALHCSAWSEVPKGGGVGMLRDAIDGVPNEQNNQCTDSDQLCVDPDESGFDDWYCECVSPQVGMELQQPVGQCTLDECHIAVIRTICTNAGQTCYDPGPDPVQQLGDWECHCPPPVGETTKGVAKVAVCDINECAYNASNDCPTCAGDTCSKDGQTCNDPNHGESVLRDWKCLCVDPEEGEAVGKAAECKLDECKGGDNECEDNGQTCEDPNHSLSVQGDWICTCKPPSTTTGVGAFVEHCKINECDPNPCPSTTPAQKCVEPDQIELNDWFCECEAPYSGSKIAGAAQCTHDECDIHREDCVPQRCRDTDTTTDENWQCECISPDVGDPVMKGKATCTSTLECLTEANKKVCEDKGQHCEDPSEELNDWTCACIEPFDGKPVEKNFATCTVDECAKPCATCQQKEVDGSKFCDEHQQRCVDDYPETLSDWVCECKLGDGMSATMSEATCVIDECTGTCITCASGMCESEPSRAAQDCIDPDTSAKSLNDWECHCRGLSDNKALVHMAASCSFDECTDTAKSGVCENAVPTQACKDTDINTPDTWECRCITPGKGSKARAPAEDCDKYDECIADCQTCAGTTCSDAKQTCKDEDLSKTNDWYCFCAKPSMGKAQTTVATDCTLDECLENREVCEHATPRQSCEDPQTSVDSKNDWFCRCDAPFEWITAQGKAATCSLDECTEAMQSGERKGEVCENAKQGCNDPIHTKLGDFVCTCNDPYDGTAVAKAATCTLDECKKDDVRAVCETEGQLCDDEDINTEPSWKCVCKTPSTGVAPRQAAQCRTDECSIAANAAVCGTQKCVDKDHLTMDDWTCVCQAPTTGSMTKAAAECLIDECMTVCATCSKMTCTTAGQDCEDVDTRATSRNDWICKCKAPTVGQDGQQAPAQCTLDECSTHTICEDAKQLCEDLDKAVASTHDWECVCKAPEEGRNKVAVADCDFDECKKNAETCTAVGQTCFDPDKKAPENWECRCDDPSEKNIAAPAVCTYTGDCTDVTVRSVCETAGQICKDGDYVKNGNKWRCECKPPARGPSMEMGEASCELDECKTDCTTCAGTTCTAADQNCKDKDVDPSSLNDWECVCAVPREGSKLTAIAMCTLDECKQHGATCEAQAQDCIDDDLANEGTWKCKCRMPATQEKVKGVATCKHDECDDHGKTCTDAGQRCRDFNTSPTRLGDWWCLCATGLIPISTHTGLPGGLPRPVSVGLPLLPPSPVGKQAGVAQCEKDECTMYGTTCTLQEQFCVDKDKSTDGTWYCQCDQSTSPTEEKGAAATCTVDECDTNGKTCTDAGQTCEDLNKSADSMNDWTCACMPADKTSTKPARGAAAKCLYDECDDVDVCDQAGQICKDNDWEKEMTWMCECEAPRTGAPVLMKAAVCDLDECSEASHSQTCSDEGQVCKDADKTAENNWECHCPDLGADTIMNSKQGAAADCTPPPQSECTDPTVNVVCTEKHQVCHDPDMTQTGDWQCECVAPATGEVGKKSSTTCVLDECSPGALPCSTCAGDTCGEQRCEDPTKDPQHVHDWLCLCVAPQKGSATAHKATCEIDECVSVCNHCANSDGKGNVCHNANQLCRDDNTAVKSEGDWVCECKAPSVGEATAHVATCTLDECVEHGWKCVDGTVCGDPEKSPSSIDDWHCTCPAPSVGDKVAPPAPPEWIPNCIINECDTQANKDLCVNVGQTCVDLDTSAGSKNDWECHCPTGPGAGRPAQCSLNECEDDCETCENDRCERAGQICNDPTSDPSKTRDWTCSCDNPTKTPKKTGGIAKCALDECSQLSNYGAHTCKHTSRYTESGCKCQCGWKSAGSGFGPGADRDCFAGCCNPNDDAGGDWCVIDKEYYTNDPKGKQDGKAEQCKLEAQGTCLSKHVDVTSKEEQNLCADEGQHCFDPNTDIGAIMDWECQCRAPKGEGLPRTGGLADCETDECRDNGKTCTDKAQICKDPTPQPDDWVCLCPKGAAGSAGKQQPATCTWKGECEQYGHICEQHSQACEDPDEKVPDNWVCHCIVPASGVSVQGAAASCEIDECTADCDTCARTTCSDAGQLCRDLSTSQNDAGDWLCECTGDWKGHRQGGVADCSIDECRSNGGAHGKLCSNAGQSCFDADPHSPNTWKCVCNAPARGVATAQLAMCDSNECIDEDIESVCRTAGQVCDDPNAKVNGDWRCVCPTTDEFGLQKPAVCTEQGWCATNGDVCTRAGQACKDGQCECISPQEGTSAAMAAAACVLDECKVQCATCADRGQGNVCTAADQTCQEGSTDPSSISDWMCVCDSGTSAVAAVASCVVNECNDETKGKPCASKGQQCTDRDTSPSSTDDWYCECIAPLQGKTERGLAMCTFDECTINSRTCAEAGQTCFDRNIAADQRDDWQCQCVGGVGDPGIRQRAECTLEGECEVNGPTCAMRQQKCVDPTTEEGDWECRCLPPTVGAPGLQTPAVCALDECNAVCGTCAEKPGGRHACESAGQTCHDPETNAWTTNDWECICAAGGDRQTAGTATCRVNECVDIENAAQCGFQQCIDPDMTRSGDWVCRCRKPESGPDGLNGPATCGIDECTVNYDCDTCDPNSAGEESGGTLCAKEAQECFDPNTQIPSDWSCVCPYSGDMNVGAAVAPCEPTGACAGANGLTCTSAGQVCVENDAEWYCQCLAPASGQRKGAAVLYCQLDECTASCTSCESNDCAVAGQACKDEVPSADSLYDWSCMCRSGNGAPSPLAPAFCGVDECDANGHICDAAQQICHDPYPESQGDWRCVCISPKSGGAVGKPATCAGGAGGAGGYNCSSFLYEPTCLAEDKFDCMWISPGVCVDRINAATGNEDDECNSFWCCWWCWLLLALLCCCCLFLIVILVVRRREREDTEANKWDGDYAAEEDEKKRDAEGRDYGIGESEGNYSRKSLLTDYTEPEEMKDLDGDAGLGDDHATGITDAMLPTETAATQDLEAAVEDEDAPQETAAKKKKLKRKKTAETEQL